MLSWHHPTPMLTNLQSTYTLRSMKAMDYPNEPYIDDNELDAFMHALVMICARIFPRGWADVRALHAAYFNNIAEKGLHLLKLVTCPTVALT